MKVNLTYFKLTGKYYSEAKYMSRYKEYWNVYKEVKDMMEERKLPGLNAYHSSYIVLVLCEHYPVPQLLLPDFIFN